MNLPWRAAAVLQTARAAARRFKSPNRSRTTSPLTSLTVETLARALANVAGTVTPPPSPSPLPQLVDDVPTPATGQPNEQPARRVGLPEARRPSLQGLFAD